MPIAKGGGGDFAPVPAGSHVARCFGVISLGTQQSPMYAASFKVQLMFEVPAETIEVNGVKTPMTISKEYSLFLSEKANLRHDLQSWRGRDFTPKELEGFEVTKVLGQPCMLSIIHKTSAKKTTYAAIASISGLPKGITCPAAFHKPISYEIDDGQNETFKALPEWVQKKIMACEEWNRRAEEQAPEHEPENEPEAGEAEDMQVPF